MRAAILTFSLFTLVGCGSPEGGVTASTAAATVTKTTSPLPAVTLLGCHDIPSDAREVTIAFLGRDVSQSGAKLNANFTSLKGDKTPHPSLVLQYLKSDSRGDVAIYKWGPDYIAYVTIRDEANIRALLEQNDGKACGLYIRAEYQPVDPNQGYTHLGEFWGGYITLLRPDGSYSRSANGGVISL